MQINDCSKHMEKFMHDFGIENSLEVENNVESIFNICSKKYAIVEKITVEFKKSLEDITSKSIMKNGSRIFWRDVYSNQVREECPFTDEGYQLESYWDLKLEIAQFGNKSFMDSFRKSEIKEKFKLTQFE